MGKNIGKRSNESSKKSDGDTVKNNNTSAVELGAAMDPREQIAYDATLPAANALRADDLIAVNLDIGTTVSTTVAVAQSMLVHRDFIAKLPDFDMTSIDGLETAGLALIVAQADYLSATSPPDALAELGDRGGKLRRSFVMWVNALVDAEIVESSRFESIPSGGGFRDTALALTAFVRAFGASDWEEVKKNSALTDAMLVEAESISQRMLALSGQRELNPAKIAKAASIRQRIFTLVVRRYDDVRRAATYMRWRDRDVDEVVPSLYAKGPRKNETQKSEPAPVATPVVATPVTKQPDVKPLIDAVPVRTVPRGLGLPNSKPFMEE